MILGIDYGATNSVSAYVNELHQVLCIPDAYNKNYEYIPSTVLMLKNQILTGHQANNQYAQNGQGEWIDQIKSLLSLNEPVLRSSGGELWYAESLTAIILKKIVLNAELILHRTVDEVVLTIPAHYNEDQKNSMLVAAAMAEIKVQCLLEEPVAAAVFYGVSDIKWQGKTFGVYDFGGGTFDASIMVVNPDGIYVLAKSGDNNLGGGDIDNILFKYFEENLISPFGDTERWPLPIVFQVRQAIQDFKISYSLQKNNLFSKKYFINNKLIELVLDRNTYNDLISPVIDKSIKVLKKAIDEASLSPKDLDGVIMVGGSSLLSGLSDIIAKELKMEAGKIISNMPFKAVAMGAALFGNRQNSRLNSSIPKEYYGVSHYNLGIRTINPITSNSEVDTILHKNMPLPSSAKRTYYTHTATQQKMAFEVIQFLDSPEECTQVGILSVGPFTNPKLHYELHLEITYDKDGLIRAEAFDPQMGLTSKEVFKRHNNLTTILINQRDMVKKAISSKL